MEVVPEHEDTWDVFRESGHRAIKKALWAIFNNCYEKTVMVYSSPSTLWLNLSCSVFNYYSINYEILR